MLEPPRLHSLVRQGVTRKRGKSLWTSTGKGWPTASPVRSIIRALPSRLKGFATLVHGHIRPPCVLIFTALQLVTLQDNACCLSTPFNRLVVMVRAARSIWSQRQITSFANPQPCLSIIKPINQCSVPWRLRFERSEPLLNLRLC